MVLSHALDIPKRPLRLTETVRIVAIADTHLEHKLHIPDGDILIHAGDMCTFGHFREIAVVSNWINTLPHAHKLIIAGNHDVPFVSDPSTARSLFNATYLQDERVTISGIEFYGSPWQPEFGGMAFNLPRGPELARVWSMIPWQTDILITHGPPKGYGDRTFGGEHVGCEELVKRIRKVKPRLHLFGHIHNHPGYWTEGPTTFVNVTTSEGKYGATVIDYSAKAGVIRIQGRKNL